MHIYDKINFKKLPVFYFVSFHFGIDRHQQRLIYSDKYHWKKVRVLFISQIKYRMADTEDWLSLNYCQHLFLGMVLQSIDDDYQRQAVCWRKSSSYIRKHFLLYVC